MIRSTLLSYGIPIMCFIISTFMVCDAENKYECSKGVYQCSLGEWVPWTKCSVSCGGSVSNRFKPICCDASYTSIDKCASDCNYTRDDYYQTRPCGQVCFNGTFNHTFNRCECTEFFTGKCCERRGCSISCNHGHCVDGSCVCDTIYEGVDCKQIKPWFVAVAVICSLLAVLLCILCLWRLFIILKQNEREEENKVQPSA